MNHKIILGIDPGPEQSAYVFICGLKILEAGYTQNDILFHGVLDWNYDMLAVEGVRSFGPKSPIGNETLITCELAGIFYQAARMRGKPADILYSNTGSRNGAKTIRVYLCGNNNATKDDVKRVVKMAFPGCWIDGKKHGPLFMRNENGKYEDHKLRAAAAALTYQGSQQYQEECKK